MMTRTLATTILSTSLLTACAGLDSDDATDQPEPAPIADTAQVKLPAELETTVLAALGTDARAARVMRANLDRLGKTHVRVRQLVHNVPVWEGEAIVHVAADGTTEVTDKRALDIDVDVTPALSAERATELARATCASCELETAPDLWIVKGTRARLTWRVQLAGINDGARVAPIVFIDAHDGSVVKSFDNVQHVTGETLYNGTQTIPAYWTNSRYYLEDNEYNLGVYDFNGNTDPDVDSFARIYSTDNVFTRKDAAQAMFSMRNVAQYFWGTHEHWNPDGNGGPGKGTSADGSGRKRLTALVDSQFVNRYGQIYGANASWWKGTMLLGQGDDETGDWMSLDVVGHEFTHGVVEYTAGLTYENESGALNESWADVFGAMSERYRLGESATTWQLAEKEFSGTPLRYMNEPTLDGDSVDHYGDLIITSSDNGGVHYNSGIGNKAFYLVAKGGNHSHGGLMYGIGADRAAKIWYLALSYMSAGSQFIDARSATQNAARDLYGYQSAEWNAVSNAWAMCGVGIVSNDGFYNGNFELDTGWTFSGRAFTTTGYPQSGTRYLMLGGAVSQPGTATQQLSVDPLAKTATLSFYVNVTTSETSKYPVDWMNVDIIDADTGASLGRAASYTNLSATSVGSYSYTGLLNITHLRGRTIQLKFDSGNSSVGPTTFRVDNVQVIANR